MGVTDITLSVSKGLSTHMEILMKTVDKSEGKVLEFGAGIFSTPLLHWMCKERRRKLVTLENKKEFYNFANGFRGPFHSVWLVEDYDSFITNKSWLTDEHWGIVFIDHEPHERRGKDAIMFKDAADYIVLHDTESEKLHGYDKIWKYFRYRYDWKRTRPWTTVVSNSKDLSWLINYRN